MSPGVGINHLGGAFSNSAASHRFSAALFLTMHKGAILLNLRPGALRLSRNTVLIKGWVGSSGRFMMISVTYHTRPCSDLIPAELQQITTYSAAGMTVTASPRAAVASLRSHSFAIWPATTSARHSYPRGW